jgi:hypothetical protein
MLRRFSRDYNLKPQNIAGQDSNALPAFYLYEKPQPTLVPHRTLYESRILTTASTTMNNYEIFVLSMQQNSLVSSDDLLAHFVRRS